MASLGAFGEREGVAKYVVMMLMNQVRGDVLTFGMALRDGVWGRRAS